MPSGKKQRPGAKLLSVEEAFNKLPKQQRTKEVFFALCEQKNIPAEKVKERWGVAFKLAETLADAKAGA